MWRTAYFDSTIGAVTLTAIIVSISLLCIVGSMPSAPSAALLTRA
jgi:hypothetical protein